MKYFTFEMLKGVKTHLKRPLMFINPIRNFFVIT